MALGTAFVSAIMPEIGSRIVQSVETSATRIETFDGSWRTVYEGSFAISGSDNITGTITSVTKFFQDEERYTITGMVADAEVVFTAILEDFNELTAAAHMMRRDDTLRGSAESDAIYGFADDDVIRGNGGNEQAFGGKGSDRIYGGADNDHLRGDAGNDLLFGGEGFDVLTGGDGKDRVDGGSGDDEVAGAAGADTFVFRRGDGSDEIIDFAEGVDRIEIRSGADEFADLVFSLGGRIISFADVQIELRLFDGTALTEDSFVFV